MAARSLEDILGEMDNLRGGLDSPSTSYAIDFFCTQIGLPGIGIASSDTTYHVGLNANAQQVFLEDRHAQTPKDGMAQHLKERLGNEITGPLGFLTFPEAMRTPEMTLSFMGNVLDKACSMDSLGANLDALAARAELMGVALEGTMKKLVDLNAEYIDALKTVIDHAKHAIEEKNAAAQEEPPGTSVTNARTVQAQQTVPVSPVVAGSEVVRGA